MLLQMTGELSVLVASARLRPSVSVMIVHVPRVFLPLQERPTIYGLSVSHNVYVFDVLAFKSGHRFVGRPAEACIGCSVSYTLGLNSSWQPLCQGTRAHPRDVIEG